MDTQGLVMAGVFSLVGAVAIVLGFVKMRRFRLIKDTPRSKIRSMAMGIVEIHGTIDTYQNTFIKAPFSKTECLYYKYEIKEYRKQSDSKKSGSTYRWETVTSGEKGIPFLARDDTGEVFVDPTGAESYIRHRKSFQQKSKGLFGNLKALRNLTKALRSWDGKDLSALTDIESLDLEPMTSGVKFTSRVGDRRYYEYYVVPGDTLFLLGTAANSPEAPNNVVIRKGQNEKTFIMSDREERGVLKELKKLMLVALLFGVIFFVAGVAILLKTIGYL